MTTPSASPTDDPTEPAGRSRLFRAPALVLALLTLVAGYSDGYALSRFDVFIANQSGNIVRAGMGVFGEYGAWRLALISIAGFAFGAVIAWMLGVPAARLGWTLVRARLAATVVVIALWWMAALLLGGDSHGLACATLGAMSMGMLASVMTRIADTPVQPAFQTATVLNSARGLVQWVAGGQGTASAGRRLLLLGLLTIGCYAMGGALGAFAVRIGSTALLAGLLLLLAALLLTRSEQATQSR